MTELRGGRSIRVAHARGGKFKGGTSSEKNFFIVFFQSLILKTFEINFRNVHGFRFDIRYLTKCTQTLMDRYSVT